MKFYTLLMPFASPHVNHLYNLAVKNPTLVSKKQIQGRYFRHIHFNSQVAKGMVHKLEEYRSPGISYRHIITFEGRSTEHKVYSLDNWIIRKIFFEFFDAFSDE